MGTTGSINDNSLLELLQEKLSLAAGYQEAGEFNKAERIAEEMLELSPDNDVVLEFAGIIAYQLGNKEKAIKLLEKAASVNPYENYFNLLGDIYYEMQNYYQAAKNYEKVVLLDAANLTVYFYLGNSYIKINRIEKGLDCLKKVFDSNPDDPNVILSLGDTFYTYCRHAESLACFRKLLHYDSNSDRFNYMIARIYFINDIYDESIPFYTRVIEINPCIKESYYDLATIYTKKNEYDKALEYYKQALNQDNNDVTALTCIGNILYESGKRNEALEYYEKAYTINKSVTEHHMKPVINLRYHFWKKSREQNKEKETITTSKAKFGIVLFPVHYHEKTHEEGVINGVNNQSYKNFKVITDVKNTNLEEFSHICFIEKGDVLPDNALNTLAMEIENSNPDVIYTDEDEVVNEERTNPHFKTEHQKFLLYAYNYMNALLCVKTNNELIDSLKNNSINQEYLYKLVFELTSKDFKIKRISDILYHRSKENKDRINNTDFKKIILEEIAKNQYKAEFTGYSSTGINQIKFQPKTNPKISIIIPFKDKLDLLKDCIESIEQKTTYSNYEILLVNNRSCEQETLEYLKNTPHRVINADIDFNFARLNNIAAEQAEGDFLVLLNNDTIIKTADWIESTLGLAELSNVGVVGPKLLYPDNTLQHIGMVKFEPGASPALYHENQKLPASEAGYMHYNNLIREYLAITGACVMISRGKYLAVGGLDETFAVEYNDVDLCFKLAEQGYKNLYNPHAEIYHIASVTRGGSFKETRIKERGLFFEKWKEQLSKPDPFYNPNFSQIHHCFMVKIDG